MIIHSKKDLTKIKKVAEAAQNEKDLEQLSDLLDKNIEDILCNQCGCSCKTSGNTFEGLIEVIAEGGFFSNFIGDENSIKFSLCEKCLSQLVKNFKYQPAKRESAESFDTPFVEPLSNNETFQNDQNNKDSSQLDTKIVDLSSKKAKK